MAGKWVQLVLADLCAALVRHHLQRLTDVFSQGLAPELVWCRLIPIAGRTLANLTGYPDSWSYFPKLGPAIVIHGPTFPNLGRLS